MGHQTHVSPGIVWLLVFIGAGFAYVRPWPTTRRMSPPPTVASSARFMIGGALYLEAAVGSILLLSGVTAGLYVAASSLTLLAVYSVTGAWLLVLGARDES
jgi:hypothetical protein